MVTELVETGVSYGMLDTSVLIDLGLYAQANLTPDICMVSTITLAELSFGVSLAKTRADAIARSQAYAIAKQLFDTIPFDAKCADIYGQLVAMVLDAGRSPRARRMDLLIAAVAVSSNVPLYTANPDDFAGLESRLEVVPLVLNL